MLIYKATNLITGKSYIGQTTKDLNSRIHKHIISSKNPKLLFHRTINKYGFDSFKWEIIESNLKNIKELNEKEIFYVIKYDTYYPNGYNLSIGGGSNSGYHHSEETRKMFSKQKAGGKHPFFGKKRPDHSRTMKGRYSGSNHPIYGKHLSNETKAKISLSGKGRIFTEEHKRKIGAAHKGKFVSMETRKKIKDKRRFQIFSEQTRKNMSIAQTGRKHSEETKGKMKLSWLKRKGLL